MQTTLSYRKENVLPSAWNLLNMKNSDEIV